MKKIIIIGGCILAFIIACVVIYLLTSQTTTKPPPFNNTPPPPPSNNTPPPPIPYSEGAILRNPVTGTVYLIENGTKRHMTPTTYNARGMPAGIPITDADVANIPNGPIV